MAAGETHGGQSCFEGLLFEGNTKDKSWTLVCQKHVTMAIRPPGGVGKGGACSLVATQREETVWEGSAGPGLRHRVKDNFVQWQNKSSDGATMTFGLRLKTAELAHEFNTSLGDTIASLSGKPHKRTASDSVELEIITPHGNPLFLSLPPTTSISQVMAIVAERYKLDPAHYNLALPAEDPKGEGVACFGSMTVSRLKTHCLYLRRQPGAPEEAWLNSGDMGIIQIELPRGEKTLVKASGDTSLPELMQMVCRKRNLEEAELKFDLPATEGSLAGKTLGQLKLTALKIVSRAESLADKQLEDNQTPTDSPKGGHRRHAPPPPSGPAQPRKAMKEVSTEVSERVKGEGREGRVSTVATPTHSGSEEKTRPKPLPPPVALKPRRRTAEEKEEVDGDSPSIPRSALDSMVIGVKVREAAERPEMGAITEGLKMAAASGGRYLSVKKRRQQSMEEPASSTHPAPLSHRRSREMEDIDVRAVRRSPLLQRTSHSLRRRLRGQAPGPPPAREQRAATLNRLALLPTKEKREGGATHKPARKAPVRPAPTRPELAKPKTTPTAKPAEKATPPSEEEVSLQQTSAVEREREEREPTPTQKEELKEEVEAEVGEEIDFAGYEFHALTPPKLQSPPPPSPPTTPSHSPNDVAVTATVVPQEGGGKTLIIRPSPSSSRKANIIFNLPPPPPPPAFSEEEGQRQDNGVENVTMETQSSTPDTSVTMATESQGAIEVSVVSNEYTNLDDDETGSEGEETAVAAALDKGTPESQEGRKTAVAAALDKGTSEPEVEEGRETAVAAALEEGRETESGGERSEGEPTAQENGVADGKEAGEGKEKALPLPMDEVAALNCNGNNNIDLSPFPPPPLEFVAPSERFPTPAPQEGFQMPTEPSFGEDSETLAKEDGGVVLVAMTSHREGLPIAEGEKAEGAEEEEVMKTSDSTSSLGTQLSIIDSLVCSMQDMAEDITSETDIVPPPPPPSPPISKSAPLTAAQPPVSKCPLPPKPPPPVTTVLSPGKPASTASHVAPPVQPASTPSHVAPPVQPASTASHVAPPVQQHQQQRKTDVAPPVQPHQQQRKTDVAQVGPSANDPQPASLWQPQSLPPSLLPGGEVGLQLQILQQQLLQQQMAQLQHQFQQLQQSLHHPAAMATPTLTMMPPAMYPHPALVAMPMAGMPGMPTTGVVPVGPVMGHLSPGTYSPPHPPSSSPLTSTPKPLTNDVIDQEQPHPKSNITAEEKSRPQSGVVEETVGGAAKDVTAQLRAGALGQLESQFDQLMEDMRETEQSALLKKVTPGPAGREGDGSYSGMAAVLAEALKERRKHFTTDRHNWTGSLEMEDSRLSEWDS